MIPRTQTPLTSAAPGQSALDKPVVPTPELWMDPEFRALIPPLTPEERAQLEANLVRDGCRDPLVVWNGLLLDGHNRYALCQQHGLAFEVVEQDLPDRAAAKEWMILNQLGRRNLPPYQRCELALELEPMYRDRAKQNQGRRTDLCQISDKSVPPIDTKKELAQQAGVSHDTLHKAQTIAAKADEATKAALRTGVVSINKAYQDLRRQTRRQAQATWTAPPLPPGHYDVLYADPPWRYEFSETDARQIENQYPTLSLADLCALAIPAADNALLLLWTTAPKVEEALSVVKAWGFTYRTNMIWDKERMGMGYWARIQHEHLLVGVKGAFPTPLPAHRARSVYREDRGPHSRKPAFFYDWIEAAFPGRHYCELFARQPRAGWTAWGNEVETKAAG